MISKEEFDKRLKENKEISDVKERMEYRTPVVEYWLKHEARLFLDSKITNISTHTSDITLLPVDITNKKKVRLMDYAFEQTKRNYGKN